MACILSVEDNKVNQLLITERMKMLGHEVLQASDGEQALTLIEQHPEIDLLLLDIGLPKKDGIQVAKWIRNTNDIKNMPIFFLTAHATVEYQQKAKEIGVEYFFTKPINFKELIIQIEKVLT